MRVQLKTMVMVLLAAGITSCAQEKLGTSTSGKTVDEVFNQKGEAYLRLDIGLAGGGADTRADGISYDDGNADEYAVDQNKSYLVIFSGKNAAESAARSVYTLSDALSGGGDDKQLSVESTITQTINRVGINANDSVFALLLLNADGRFEFGSGDNEAANTLKVKDASNYIVNNTVTPVNNMKYTDFAKLDFTSGQTTKYQPLNTSNDFMTKKTGGATNTLIFMTNATLADKGAGDAASAKLLNVLAPINMNYVYTTTPPADAKPAATITVERAVAKVTLKKGTNTDDKISKQVFGTSEDLDYTVEAWQLINANKKTYFIKHVTGVTADGGQGNFYTYRTFITSAGGSATNRFLEKEPVALDGGYRINWAITPEYTTAYNSSTLFPGDATAPLIKGTATGNEGLASGDVVYPLENTFNVDNMVKGKATGVLVKVKAADPYDVDFWTTSEAPAKRLTAEELKAQLIDKMLSNGNITKLAEKFAADAANDYGKDNESYLTNWKILLNKMFTLNVNAAALPYKGLNIAGINVAKYQVSTVNPFVYTLSGTDITSDITDKLKQDDAITDADNTIEGLTMTEGNITGGATGSGETGAYTEVIAILKSYLDASFAYLKNSTLKFNYFKGGEMYYRAYIRHFNDVETPWNKVNGGETPLPKGQYIYPKAEAEASGATYETQGKNYLGRYGIVRNHSYELEVNKISKLGSPLPPSLTDDEKGSPVDDLNSSMKMTVRILRWAKHTQGLDF